MPSPSREASSDATVLLVAAGEPFVDSLLARLEEAGLFVELAPPGGLITEAFIVPPDAIVLAGEDAADGGRAVMAVLAQRTSTAEVPVMFIGAALPEIEADAGQVAKASRLDPALSHDEMARQIAERATSRTKSAEVPVASARTPEPSPMALRAPAPAPPRAPVGAPLMRTPTAAKAPPAAGPVKAPTTPGAPIKALPTPSAAAMAPKFPKPISKTLQFTALRAPTATAGVPAAPTPAATLPGAPLPTAPLPAAPLAVAPLPAAPLAAAPETAAPLAAAPETAATLRGAALPATPVVAPQAPIDPIPQAVSPSPPVSPDPRARARRSATLVGIPSPVARPERPSDPTPIAERVTPVVADRPTPVVTERATPVAERPTPVAQAGVFADAPTSAPHAPIEPSIVIDLHPDPTEASIQLPELLESDLVEPQSEMAPGEATDASIALPDDLASPPAETSDFAIAFPRDEEDVSRPSLSAPTSVAPEQSAAPSYPAAIPHPLTVTPVLPARPPADVPYPVAAPKRRSLWPLVLGVLVVVLVAAGGAGALVYRAQMASPASVAIGTLPTLPIEGSAPIAPPVVPPPFVAPPVVAPPVVTPPVGDGPAVAPPVDGTAAPVVAEPVAEPVVGTPLRTPEPDPVPAPVLGVHLPLSADEPIEGTDAEFDLARLGVVAVPDPGSRGALRRRIERLLATAYRERSRGRLDASEEACRSVLALDGENPRATVGLALVYANRGDHVNAVLFARRLVRLRAYPNNFVLLGERYLAGGDAASARRAFSRALELDPRHRDARAALARLP
jgi:hypothetical protein